jgi:hypothetical protein
MCAQRHTARSACQTDHLAHSLSVTVCVLLSLQALGLASHVAAQTPSWVVHFCSLHSRCPARPFAARPARNALIARALPTQRAGGAAFSTASATSAQQTSPWCRAVPRQGLIVSRARVHLCAHACAYLFGEGEGTEGAAWCGGYMMHTITSLAEESGWPVNQKHGMHRRPALPVQSVPITSDAPAGAICSAVLPLWSWPAVWLLWSMPPIL